MVNGSPKIQLEPRVAIPDDARDIALVHDSSRRQAYADLLKPEQLNAMSLDERTSFWRQRLLLAQQNDLRVFVIEDENQKLCGFIAVESNRAKNHAEIDRIYVMPTHARQGVGRALIKIALDHLRDYGFEKTTLWTFERNASARAFYSSQGFKPDGAERKWSGMPKEVRYAIKIEPW